MCGLCGILGREDHWSELLGATAADEISHIRRRERLTRVRYLNRVLCAFSCSVSDWQGARYLISTFTGKTELADDLGQIWSAVERLTGQKVDPLLGSLLNRLREAP